MSAGVFVFRESYADETRGYVCMYVPGIFRKFIGVKNLIVRS